MFQQSLFISQNIPHNGISFSNLQIVEDLARFDSVLNIACYNRSSLMTLKLFISSLPDFSTLYFDAMFSKPKIIIYFYTILQSTLFLSILSGRIRALPLLSYSP